MSANQIDIYVPHLDEGTDVLGPTAGEVLGSETVRILATHDYDRDIEKWEFLPGTTVKCWPEFGAGREILVARQRVA